VYFLGKSEKNNKDIFSTEDTIKIYEIENKPTEYINQLPSPRTFKAIEINFTPRHFSTPSRESTKADEQEVKLYVWRITYSNDIVVLRYMTYSIILLITSVIVYTL